jgi:hypothetical protein
MKTCWMIRKTAVVLQKPFRGLVRLFLLSGLLVSLQGAPPAQLRTVIDHFMNLTETSMNLTQVIDWRFGGRNDTLYLEMDIQTGQQFHLLLANLGMEIFVHGHEMITLNHIRQQILYENADPDALLNQLFVGGDLNDARYKGEEKLGDGRRKLNFQFYDDFSDWESLQVVLDSADNLRQLMLEDYDGNLYTISLEYLDTFRKFALPDTQTEYIHYQIADLRE